MWAFEGGDVLLYAMLVLGLAGGTLLACQHRFVAALIGEALMIYAGLALLHLPVGPALSQPAQLVGVLSLYILVGVLCAVIWWFALCRRAKAFQIKSIDNIRASALRQAANYPNEPLRYIDKDGNFTAQGLKEARETANQYASAFKHSLPPTAESFRDEIVSIIMHWPLHAIARTFLFVFRDVARITTGLFNAVGRLAFR